MLTQMELCIVSNGHLSALASIANFLCSKLMHDSGAVLRRTTDLQNTMLLQARWTWTSTPWGSVALRYKSAKLELAPTGRFVRATQSQECGYHDRGG